MQRTSIPVRSHDEEDDRKGVDSDQAADTDRRIQERLLPFMVSIIVATGIFFGAVSYLQFQSIEQEVQFAPSSIQQVFQQFEERSPDSATSQSFQYIEWKSRAVLEADIVARRYHQASVAMLARIWTVYLAFTTGMIMALIGTAFILGRLRDSLTNINYESDLFKTSLATSSPGIVLAFLGTTLIIIAILARNEIDVRDAPQYFLPAQTGSTGLAEPRALPDPGQPDVPGPLPCPPGRNCEESQ